MITIVGTDEDPVPGKQQYVVVNLAMNNHGIVRGVITPNAGHPVMPGEDPHTYYDLDCAAEGLAYLFADYGHTLDTATIFRLLPLPRAEVARLVTEALERIGEHPEGADAVS